jgi:hypothetical protein
VAYFDIRQEPKAVCRYRHSRYTSLLAEFDPLTSRIRTASYYNVMFITAGHRFLVMLQMSYYRRAQNDSETGLSVFIVVLIKDKTARA